MFLRIRILKHLALFLSFQIISPLKLGDLAYFIGLNLKSSSRNKLFVPEMVDVSRVVQAKKYIKKWLQPDIHRGKCDEKFTLKSIRFMWANNGTWERRRWKRLNINTYHILNRTFISYCIFKKFINKSHHFIIVFHANDTH